MTVTVFCIIVVLYFLISPIGVVADGEIDAYENDGYLSVKIFGIPVFRCDITFESKDITHNNLIVKHGSKYEEIHLNTDKEDEKSLANMPSLPPFIKFLQVRSIDMDAYIGNRNALYTMLIASSLKLAFCSVASYFKTRQNTVISERLSPEFGTDKFEIFFRGIICVSIANIIYGYMEKAAYSRRKSRRIGGKALDRTT